MLNDVLTPQQEGVAKVRACIEEDGHEGGAARPTRNGDGAVRVAQRDEGEIVRVWLVRDDGTVTWYS